MLNDERGSKEKGPLSYALIVQHSSFAVSLALVTLLRVGFTLRIESGNSVSAILRTSLSRDGKTMASSTPMLRQYQELKRQHPGTLLFFRLGDFYELFFDDAVTGARELEITLTARHKERGDPIPMCGVPHHAASTHIARLVRRGYRVAVCEQTEDPAQAKKLVRREVVRIITPGTAIDPQLLAARETVYLSAVCGTGERMAAAFLDLSTGEFRATEASGREAWARIRADLEAYAPREILFPASLAPLIKRRELSIKFIRRKRGRHLFDRFKPVRRRHLDSD